MPKYETLASMMLTPGNKEIWEKYLNANFVNLEVTTISHSIIKYLCMERDLVASEDVWTPEEKINRLTSTIKSKIKKASDID